MQANFHIAHLSTWEILERFGKVLAEGAADATVSHVNVQCSFFNESTPLNLTGKSFPANPAWLGKLKFFKEHAYIDADRIELPFGSNWTLRYQRTGNPVSPQVVLEIHDSYRIPAQELKFMDAISHHFTIIPLTQITSNSLSEVQLAGFKFAEKTIAAFATEAARLSQSTAKNFEEFVVGVKQRSLELESQFQTKATELENLYRQKQIKLEEENVAKIKLLEKREASHDEAVKSFELRNNTAVRRDLLKEIRIKIEEQKSIVISPATVKKRIIIHVVCTFTMLAALCMVGLYATKLFKDPSFEWKLLIPLSTWTVLFVMTGIYYIRWNDQWFREHARVEFENRKFSADILRASWVAELFFEWAEKKGIAMPPELVASFTKNLFDNPDLDGKLHPTDQVGELVKQFSTLEIGKSGFKVTRKEETKI